MAIERCSGRNCPVKERCTRYLVEDSRKWPVLLNAPFKESPFRCLFYIKHDFQKGELDNDFAGKETSEIDSGEGGSQYPGDNEAL